MFDSLSDRLGSTLQKLRGQGRLTESNIKDSLREVRMALLEADVALPVVKAFIDRVKERAMGQDVLRSLTPGQALIKVVNDELVAVMGDANESLNLNMQPPAVIFMAGLQGAGKTTSVAKLARWLKENQKKSVMVASADVYRPAAIEQLKKEGLDIRGPFPSDSLFHEAARRRYDAVICMYHDQALIPSKTLDFDSGVNVTLGLPVVRTSPDHGTAFDIAGTGKADPGSLTAAITVAAQMAAARHALSNGTSLA